MPAPVAFVEAVVAGGLEPAEVPWRIRLMVLRDQRLAIGSIDMQGSPGAGLAWLLAQPGVRRPAAERHPEHGTTWETTP